jgi:hypothetical protein
MMERTLSPEELRFYLLYWDHVVIPANNLVFIGVPEEEDLLACGAIARPCVQYSGTFEGDQVANAILACQGLVAKQLSGVPDVDWVLHQFGGDVLTVPGMAQEEAALRIRVASVLPVPPAATRISDVLEFKERKAESLAGLHDTLDKLYLDILRTPDVELGARRLVSELRSEIESLASDTRTTSGWRRFDLSVEFRVRLRDVIVGLTAGSTFGAAAGANPSLTAAIGAIASLIEVKLSQSHTLGTASQTNRLAYLSDAKAERLLP